MERSHSDFDLSLQALRQSIGDIPQAADVVVLSGRSNLRSLSSHAVLALPLRGCLRVNNGDNVLALGPQHIYVGESGRSVELTANLAGAWIGLLISDRAWRALVRAGREAGMPALPALTAVHSAVAPRRALLNLLHRLEEIPCSRLRVRDGLELYGLIADLQARFLEEIDRCPGRTQASRIDAFRNLHRVRNYIEARPQAGTQLSDLARMANYSTCHLVRAFAQAFGETPYALLSRIRLESAAGLLEEQRLAVSDVANECGFESRTAFSRAFKRHFGISPSSVCAATPPRSP